MSIPLSYSVRSAFVRWVSTTVAMVGIGSTVGVLAVVLAMARGFEATLTTTGSPTNAIVLRAGADSEMTSVVTLEQTRIIGDAPSVARSPSGQPLVSGEVVVIAPFPLRDAGTEANVQVRGLSPLALEVRPEVELVDGRMFRPGRLELMVGRNAIEVYRGLELGAEVEFGGGRWSIVGAFDAGGTAFDSEVWCDARVLNGVYRRPETIFQSVTARLTDRDAFASFKDALTSDPRLSVDVDREAAYYARKSRAVTTLIRVLGFLVAAIMALGAVLAALNTMYASVAARTTELATLRALGFGGGAVVAAILVEAVAVALAGGALGCLAALPFNGFTTGTMNWQTFSHLAFAFRVTPGILAAGMSFALLMGLAGGLPPAIRAARLPVATALREL